MRYGAQRAIIDIDTLAVLKGSLSPRVLGLVVEWAAQHQDELRANWYRARRMLKDIVEVKAVSDCRLRLRFEDGTEGEVDISTVVPFEGVFAPLRDPTVFAGVRINPELGTICWPNGADLDPDVLYALVRGEPIPDLRQRSGVSTA